MDLTERMKRVVAAEVEKTAAPYPYREPLIGYASAHDKMYDQLSSIIGNPQLHPTELLKDAQTVVVYFLPFAKEMADLSRKEKDVPILKEWSEYYTETNITLQKITVGIQTDLCSLGYSVAIQPPTLNYDDTKLTAVWSHKSNAVIAGIGTFGLNHLLITKYGTMGRLGSLVTNAKITPTTRPNTEYCLYYKNGSCKQCVNRCPSGALTTEGLDKFRCDAYLYGKNIRDTAQGCPGCSSGPCAIQGFE